MSKVDSNEIIQVGIVVRDIEKAARNYAGLFGLEMPNIRVAAPNVTYRGKPITPGARLCSFKMGAVSLELVQPDGQPSTWQEFLDKKGEGVHHIGIVVKDKEEAVKLFEDRGMPLRQLGILASGSYSMMDSEEELGVVYNVKYNNPK